MGTHFLQGAVANGGQCRAEQFQEHDKSEYPGNIRNEQQIQYREEDIPGEYSYALYRTSTSACIPQVEPYICRMELNGVPTVMELDTGAGSTIVSSENFKKFTDFCGMQKSS